VAQLRTLAMPATPEALRHLLKVPPGWADADVFFRSRNVPPPQRMAMAAAAGAVTVGGLLLAPTALVALRTAITEALATHHRLAAEQPGLQIDRLRLALADRPPIERFPEIVDALLHEGAIARDGPWLRLPGHRVALSAQDEKLWPAVRARIAANRFRPPRVRDLALALKVPENVLRSTLKRLQRMGQVVEVASDLFFLRETAGEMAGIAAASVDEAGLLTAAVFRDRLDNGRKVAIQILEFFDRTGVTVRVGDARRMRPGWAGSFWPGHEPERDGAG
jgi:selenocysteine-specific elongation factor